MGLILTPEIAVELLRICPALERIDGAAALWAAAAAPGGVGAGRWGSLTSLGIRQGGFAAWGMGDFAALGFGPHPASGPGRDASGATAALLPQLRGLRRLRVEAGLASSWRSLCAALPALTGLTSLEISGVDCDTDDGEPLPLAACTGLRELWLSEWLGQGAVRELAAAGEALARVTRLALASSDSESTACLPAADTKSLTAAFPSLVEMELRNVSLCEAPAAAAVFPHLTRLKINTTAPGSQGWAASLLALEVCDDAAATSPAALPSGLRELRLSCPHQGDDDCSDGMEGWMRAVGRLSSLTKLECRLAGGAFPRAVAGGAGGGAAQRAASCLEVWAAGWPASLRALTLSFAVAARGAGEVPLEAVLPALAHAPVASTLAELRLEGVCDGDGRDLVALAAFPCLEALRIKLGWRVYTNDTLPYPPDDACLHAVCAALPTARAGARSLREVHLELPFRALWPGETWLEDAYGARRRYDGVPWGVCEELTAEHAPLLRVGFFSHGETWGWRY
ncbi:MAG: hypothetical protein J3K34DRAFT_404542 [Monoraphidium minutum]|nr:MAG: hypothetical protein J3K34DRAFT_404542 [Monoraphidium minutum]